MYYILVQSNFDGLNVTFLKTKLIKINKGYIAVFDDIEKPFKDIKQYKTLWCVQYFTITLVG